MSRYVGNVDVDKLIMRKGDTILDVGCGAGHVARQFAASGYTVVGVEPSERLRAEFAAAVSGSHVGAHDVVDGVAEALPFPAASWKAIVMTEVLEHVEDPERVLRELHRVMAPAGRLCLSVPTSFSERLF